MTGESLHAPDIAAPGFFHLPLEGCPESGDVVITTAGPSVALVLGEVAERPVVVTVTTGSLEWLGEIASAVQTAQTRLSAALFPVPPGPTGLAA